MPFCPNCGTKVPEGSKFCANCGASIATQVPTVVSPTSYTPPTESEGHTYGGTIVALVLIGILAVGVWYGIGYQSAEGIQIAISNGEMSYRTGLLGYAEFDVSVTVSSTGTLGTTISQVSFSLTIDSVIPFSTVQAEGWTFGPGQSIQYVLKFTSYDSTDLQYIIQGGSHQVTVTIRAWSSSLAYSGWILSSATKSWNWNSAS